MYVIHTPGQIGI